MEYTGLPDPSQAASYKAFDVSDFSITVYPTGLCIAKTLPAKVS